MAGRTLLPPVLVAGRAGAPLPVRSLLLLSGPVTESIIPIEGGTSPV